MTAEQAVIDVTEAQAMGFDAFALNLISAEDWCLMSINMLFTAALAIGFHLFFSFDMLHFSVGDSMFGLIEDWVTHDAYYIQDTLPFVSMSTHFPIFLLSVRAWYSLHAFLSYLLQITTDIVRHILWR